MQAGAVFLGQFYSLTRRCQTGLLTTNQRMQANLRIITPSLLGLLHIAVDDICILTMRHQGQLAGLEDTLQRLLSVNQHIACRRTHKQFHARNALRWQLGKKVAIVVGSTKEERIVDVAFLAGQREFLFQRLQRGCLRYTVGHIEITRHTTCSSSTALCVNVCLCCQSWLTEMYVVVYHAWQHVTARGINRLIKRCLGLLFGNLNNVALLNDDKTV